jgi:hypothetical protein
VQDVVLGPDGHRLLTLPGPQLGGIARPPDPHHVLAVGQAGRGELRGGPAPVGRQDRPAAVGERLPAGCLPLGIGDRRVADRVFLACLLVGPDREPVLGIPDAHTPHYKPGQPP